MSDPRPEKRQHGIADDLVDLSSEADDVGGQPLHTFVDQVLERLWIKPLRQCGEPHDVAEDHGNQPALIGVALQ